ncbi:hypothetical protein SAMN02745157_3807 [Kaistia soli DSM 19436]|uniref:Uncharacterized protein n=1 Tax=Kaistia soli DSM 19436 TaxID=1122133 RepID=A0A1M5I9L3_9HYPH|nr:hypothetical protein SAMN02745157_3807 [Kaistia soli DSM 19436]
MADALKVGDLVRLVFGGRVVAIHSVDTTPGGTVMIGCGFVDQASVSKLPLPLGRRPTIH